MPKQKRVPRGTGPWAFAAHERLGLPWPACSRNVLPATQTEQDRAARIAFAARHLDSLEDGLAVTDAEGNRVIVDSPDGRIANVYVSPRDPQDEAPPALTPELLRDLAAACEAMADALEAPKEPAGGTDGR